MKTNVYLRIGKLKNEKFKVEASDKPNHAPLKAGSRWIPTVAFGVEFEIPDELFRGASLIVGILKINAEEAKIAANIKVPKLKP